MVGSCSAGKSTVLNSILGGDVNPMGVDPTTSCIVGIRPTMKIDPKQNHMVSLVKCGQSNGLEGHVADPNILYVANKPECARNTQISTRDAISDVARKIAETNTVTREKFKANSESKQNRAVFAWGDNKNGELGGMTDRASSFEALTRCEGLNIGCGEGENGAKPEFVKQVACGSTFSIALTHDPSRVQSTSSIMRWGNMPGMDEPATFAKPCPLPEMSADVFVTQIACGKMHALLLGRSPHKKGQVFAFGQGKYGQTGLPGAPKAISEPHLVVECPAEVRQVAAGGFHSVVVTQGGRVAAFGKNNCGQLGIDCKDSQVNSPKMLPQFAEPVVSVACGCEHSFVLTDQGSAYGFGRNIEGQLGLGLSDKYVPLAKLIPSMSISGHHARLIQIVCGHNHSVALTEGRLGGHLQRKVFSTGCNQYGQLALSAEDLNTDPCRSFMHSAAFDDFDPNSILCTEHQTIVHTTEGIVFAGKRFGKPRKGEKHGAVKVERMVSDHFEELGEGKPGVCLAQHSLPSQHAVCLRSDGAGDVEDLALLLEERYRVTMPVAIDLQSDDIITSVTESAPVESLPGEPEPETHPTLTVTADSAPPSRDYKYEFIDVPGHNEAGDLGEAAATAQQLLVHECHIIVWVVKVGSMNESIFESTRKMLATCMETHQCNEFKFPTITVALTHVDTLEGCEEKLQQQIDFLLEKAGRIRDGRLKGRDLIDKQNIFPMNGKAALKARLHAGMVSQQLSDACDALDKLNVCLPLDMWTALCDVEMESWSEEHVLQWMDIFTEAIVQAELSQIKFVLKEAQTDGADLINFVKNPDKFAKRLAKTTGSTNQILDPTLQPVSSLLNILKLETFDTPLRAEGYEFVGDLIDADDDDLQQLPIDIGMKKPQAKRFVKAVHERKDAGEHSTGVTTTATVITDETIATIVKAIAAHAGAEAECKKARLGVDELSQGLVQSGITQLEKHMRSVMTTAYQEIFLRRRQHGLDMLSTFQTALRYSADNTLEHTDGFIRPLCDPDPAIYQVVKDKEWSDNVYGVVAKGAATVVGTTGAAVAGFIALGFATGGVGWGLGIALGVTSGVGGLLTGAAGLATGLTVQSSNQLRQRLASQQGQQGVTIARQFALKANEQSDDCVAVGDMHIPTRSTMYHDWILYTDQLCSWEEAQSADVTVKREAQSIDIVMPETRNVEELGMTIRVHESFVCCVEEDSIAAKAGIKPKSTIMTVNGEEVLGSAEIALVLESTKPGDEVPFVVLPPPLDTPMFVGPFTIVCRNAQTSKSVEDTLKSERFERSKPGNGIGRFFHRNGVEALIGRVENGVLRGDAVLFQSDGKTSGIARFTDNGILAELTITENVSSVTKELQQREKLARSMGPEMDVGRPDAWSPSPTDRTLSGHPLRILCIDGGGIKGLVPSIVLAHIEKLCAPHRIHELFDLCCGTSTGGIIALGTCVAKVPPHEMADVYEKKAAEIFTKSGLTQRGSVYDASNLEIILQEKSANKHGPQRRLDDNLDALPKVFVVAASEKSAKGADAPYQQHMFRSYAQDTSVNSGSSDCYLWEAGRATSAAPSYFKPISINGQSFVDGGVLANNPIRCALDEAQDIWPGRPIGCVVSLGCGLALSDREEAGLFNLGLMKNVQHQLTHTQPDHEKVLEDFRIQFKKSPPDQAYTYGGTAHNPRNPIHKDAMYLRLNPPLSEQVLFDSKDAAELASLRTQTEQYLKDPETIKRFDQLKECLKGPSSVPEGIPFEGFDEPEPEPATLTHSKSAFPAV